MSILAEASLRVHLGPNSNLDFSEAVKKLSEVEEKVFIEVDLDLDFDSALFYHPMRYSTYKVAVQEFDKVVAAPFEEKIAGVSLYKGETDISRIIGVSEELKEAYQEWLDDYCLIDSPFEKELFSLSLLIEFLHNLGSYLPPDLPIHSLFTESHKYSLAELAQMFSKDRFMHLHYGLEESPLPFDRKAAEATAGIVLPLDENIDRSLLDQNLKRLLQCTTSFRLLPERLITEEWHGLDTIFVMTRHMTKEATRMLKGFNAAGGKVVFFDEPAGVPNECSFEEFLS